MIRKITSHDHGEQNDALMGDWDWQNRAKDITPCKIYINMMAHLVASLKRDSPSRIITMCSGTFPPDFKIELTATASVLDVMAANKAACCQYQPNFARSNTYKSTGTMIKVLASTTSRANEMMCKRTCINKHTSHESIFNHWTSSWLSRE